MLISGQDTHPSLKGLTPSHRRPCRQPGDMVTGATNIFGTTTAEIHEQSLAPAKKSNHVSTSLEPFDRTQSRSSDANQPATPDSHVEDIKDRSDKAVPSDKPEISPLPTNEPIGIVYTVAIKYFRINGCLYCRKCYRRTTNIISSCCCTPIR